MQLHPLARAGCGTCAIKWAGNLSWIKTNSDVFVYYFNPVHFPTLVPHITPCNGRQWRRTGTHRAGASVVAAGPVPSAGESATEEAS